MGFPYCLQCLTDHFYCYRHNVEKQRYIALQKWNESLENIHSALVGKIAGANRAGFEGGAMGVPAEALYSGVSLGQER